jgi:hypothetical protein
MLACVDRFDRADRVENLLHECQVVATGDAPRH